MTNTKRITGAATIAEYKIRRFLNENFEDGALTLEVLDGKTIRATDRTGERMIFSWNDEAQMVEWQDA